MLCFAAGGVAEGAMSNLGKDFRKWRSNLRHEIHATPSMNWAAGRAPVSSTTHFHVVGDLTAATSCYITGHGGADSDDYFFDNKAFRVPAGVSLKTCIAEVTKAAPNLTTFNCLFCRVDENSGDESWDIEGFWST